MDFKEVASAIQVERDAWQAYRDATEDESVLEAMKRRDLAHISDEDIQEAKDKVSLASRDWNSKRVAARTLLADFLSAHGLKSDDLGSICRY